MVSYGLCSISRDKDGSIRHYSLTKTQSSRLEKVPIVKERTITTKEKPQRFGELPQGFNPFAEHYKCPPWEREIDAYDCEEAHKRAIRQSEKEEHTTPEEHRKTRLEQMRLASKRYRDRKRTIVA
jgi:hypothetical protein